MTLTIGTGPFGDQGDKTFNFEVRAPRDHVLFFEDSPRRVRVMFGGETVADSRRVKLMHEQGHLPVYYFPTGDVRMDLLEATDLTTHCPAKGDASYWSVKVGDRVAENAVWGYPEPIDSAPPLTDYLAFYWHKLDHWYEEDEEVFVHPRDPYHRVDVLKSSRHVKVLSMGRSWRRRIVPGSSSRPVCRLATTSPLKMSPRTYSSPATRKPNVPTRGLRLTTRCRRAVRRGKQSSGTILTPIPAAADIAGHLCFFNEKVDLEVDGEAQQRPQTQWS